MQVTSLCVPTAHLRYGNPDCQSLALCQPCSRDGKPWSAALTERRAGGDVNPASKINEAYERVLASNVRYRFVIDAATLK
jgi:hypothetical protein